LARIQKIMAKILKILAKILFQLYSSSSSSSSQASLYLRELGSFVPSSSTPLTHWTDILHIYPFRYYSGILFSYYLHVINSKMTYTPKITSYVFLYRKDA